MHEMLSIEEAQRPIFLAFLGAWEQIFSNQQAFLAWRDFELLFRQSMPVNDGLNDFQGDLNRCLDDLLRSIEDKRREFKLRLNRDWERIFISTESMILSQTLRGYHLEFQGFLEAQVESFKKRLFDTLCRQLQEKIKSEAIIPTQGEKSGGWLSPWSWTNFRGESKTVVTASEAAQSDQLNIQALGSRLGLDKKISFESSPSLNLAIAEIEALQKPRILKVRLRQLSDQVLENESPPSLWQRIWNYLTGRSTAPCGPESLSVKELAAIDFSRGRPYSELVTCLKNFGSEADKVEFQEAVKVHLVHLKKMRMKKMQNQDALVMFAHDWQKMSAQLGLNVKVLAGTVFERGFNFNQLKLRLKTQLKSYQKIWFKAVSRRKAAKELAKGIDRAQNVASILQSIKAQGDAAFQSDTSDRQKSIFRNSHGSRFQGLLNQLLGDVALYQIFLGEELSGLPSDPEESLKEAATSIISSVERRIGESIASEGSECDVSSHEQVENIDGDDVPVSEAPESKQSCLALAFGESLIDNKLDLKLLGKKLNDHVRPEVGENFLFASALAQLGPIIKRAQLYRILTCSRAAAANPEVV